MYTSQYFMRVDTFIPSITLYIPGVDTINTMHVAEFRGMDTFYTMHYAVFSGGGYYLYYALRSIFGG